MSKLDQLKTILEAKGLWAKKSLGQNFLIDENKLNKIVESADLKATDNIIEVGPGTGFLTSELIQNAGKVKSIELDSDMVEILKEQYKFSDNLEILNQDILDFDINKLDFKDYKVVANIPYYITSPLIKHFLQSSNRPKLMVILVQKEVAEKICGINDRGVITIETQMFGKTEINMVPSKCFYPAPKVDSAILKISVYKKPLVDEKNIDGFLRIVKFGFSQKRKKLANSLGAGLHLKPIDVRKYLFEAGINEDIRAEDLEIDDWKRLVNVIDKSK